jgi:hypothetical protein
MKKFAVAVVVIISVTIICELCVVSYRPINDLSPTRATAWQLCLFETALAKFKLDVKAYPDKLKYLWHRPSNEDSENWQGPYMDGFEEIPDAWDRPYRYEVFDKG